MYLTQQERDIFFEDVRGIYHATAQYFKTNLPLKNSFLRDVQVLHPSFQSIKYTDEIPRIAKAVPGLLNDTEVDHVRDEWLGYSFEDINETWITESKNDDGSKNGKITYHRIDYYWNRVLSIKGADGCLKFPTLSKLIKNILIIPHGNADVERGFSINENIVTTNRSSLSSTSVNGLRSTYDGVKFAGNGSSHKVYVNIIFIGYSKDYCLNLGIRK